MQPNNPSQEQTTSSTPSGSRSEKTRARRRQLLKRDSQLPPLQLTKRDIALIVGVYELRAATSVQLQRLFFPVTAENGSQQGRLTHCQHRLKLLFHHGYLARDERPTRLSDGRLPLVYFLDSGGAAVVASTLGVEVSELDWRARDNTSGAGHLFLDHLLATNDVRIAIQQAAVPPEFELERWMDDRTLRRAEMKEYVTISGEAGKTAIVPDGFFTIAVAGQSRFHHFLEADRRTVVGLSSKSGRRDWARKVKAYMAYHESGQYERRYGAREFRVLTVTTGETRLENLLRITEAAGGKSRFWFTTFDALTPETAFTAPIWAVAGQATRRALLR